jgi:hypothetical protein
VETKSKASLLNSFSTHFLRFHAKLHSMSLNSQFTKKGKIIPEIDYHGYNKFLILRDFKKVNLRHLCDIMNLKMFLPINKNCVSIARQLFESIGTVQTKVNPLWLELPFPLTFV